MPPSYSIPASRASERKQGSSVTARIIAALASTSKRFSPVIFRSLRSRARKCHYVSFHNGPFKWYLTLSSSSLRHISDGLV